MIVKIIAITPIFIDLYSPALKYFHAYHNPKGGKNTLTAYMIICLNSVVSGGLSFNCFPQLGQKYAAAGIPDLHEGQIVSVLLSIYCIHLFYQKFAQRANLKT